MSLVEGRKLVDAALVATAAERRVEEQVEEPDGQFWRRQSGAEREHVDVVVLAAEKRRAFVTDGGGPHAWHLVGGDGHANSGAADEHTPVECACRDAPGHLLSEVRIVHRVGRGRAEVFVADATLVETISEASLQVDASVIGAERDAHGGIIAEKYLPVRRRRLGRSTMSVVATAVVSRRGVERIRARHPWIFKSDVLDVSAEPGDLVSVSTERGRPLGWAQWSSSSQIALRMVSFSSSSFGTELDWLSSRVRKAAAYRASLNLVDSAWRLVYGESDGLPATVVDRYGDELGDIYFVVQTLSQGSDRRLAQLVAVLVEQFAPRGIVTRNDPKVRALEGLPQSVEVVYGEVPDRVTVLEGGVRYIVDLCRGQKTGLFLDQRENHATAAAYARGSALDGFTYNGGFALQMARHADHVVALDSSEQAVTLTQENASRNGLSNVEVREANVFDELREFEIARRRFDTIVLDPPAFAKNRASVERAIAGYKEINLRAMRLLSPGGHLITCSCSYNVDEPTFLGVLQAAAADAQASMVVVERRLQARDHPVLVTVPETAYLKCVVLRRVDEPASLL